MLMFQMDLETAEEFYRLCHDRKAVSQKERTAILIELAQKGKMQSVIETNRTPDQVAKDAAKNFGNVLYIKPKKNSRRTK